MIRCDVVVMHVVVMHDEAQLAPHGPDDIHRSPR